MKRFCFVVVALLLCVDAVAQRHTISGTITDASTGETLIGATVYDFVSGMGAVTNQYGFYSLTLKADTVALRVSFVGYKAVIHGFRLKADTTLNQALSSSVELHEVVVTAERPTSPMSSQMSAISIPVEHLKAVPVLFGEVDVLKTIQLLPGVQSSSEGMSGMHVRGGGPDENLFLLDGVPLYNVNHMGGFFSAFNGDAVKNVTLYKGSFPAHFGGRLSSVLDITTNNGNDKEYHGSIGVGAISAKLNIEGPIIKEKTTFSLSARRTYGDVLLQPFIKVGFLAADINTTAGYYFYDVNAKVTHKFSEKSRLFASYYMGDDAIYLKVKTRDRFIYESNYKEYLKMRYGWGNMVGSIRWNYVLNPKLFMNVSGSYTRYRNKISLGLENQYYSDTYYQVDSMEMSYKSGIRDYTARVDFDYSPNPNHDVKFGGSYIHRVFTPEVMGMKYETHSNDTTLNETMDTTLGQSVVRAHEFIAFIEDDWKIGNAVKLNYGVAMSGFGVEGRFYPSIQPRLSARYLLAEDLSIKAGYAFMTQYMHLLSNSSISLPTDLWVPVTARIEPMYAHQVAMGVSYGWKSLIDFSLEGYYKRMTNLMEYKDGTSFWGSSVGWEDKVCMGDGWSYGVEFLAQKTVGKYSGWVGYTWSRTMRLFDREGQELSGGQPFPAKYDRRHDVSVVFMYKPNDNFDCSLSWVYCSGNTATLAMHEFEGESNSGGYWDNETTNYDENRLIGTYGYIEGRNNFRMPAYHRMDVSVNFHKKKKHGVRTWNISVYNAYNRQNPYIVYESERYHYTYNGQYYGNALVQLSLFPIIPSASYIYKF